MHGYVNACAVAHVLDTAQSWFTTDPTSGEYDDGAWWDSTLSALFASATLEPATVPCALLSAIVASGRGRGLAGGIGRLLEGRRRVARAHIEGAHGESWRSSVAGRIR